MGDEESLLKWLKTFQIGKIPEDIRSLSDGVLLAAVLHSIDPGWFSDGWLGKIKQDTGANWRLKVSNLKKIYDKVIDAYRENYGQRLSPQLLPDVNSIGERQDKVQIQRLIKLVLGCAVLCERKTEFIRAILGMEEINQQAIMCMIQELNLGSDDGHSGSGESLVAANASLGIGEAAAARLQDELKLKQALLELEAAIEQKELLQQTCQRMDLQIQHLTEQRTSLKALVAELQEKTPSIGDNAEDQRCKELRKQLDAMQEEIFKLETSRDEYRVRTEMLERELNDLRMRQDELQGAANQARSLKDEVDILREAAGRLAKAEATVEGLRKKLEECSELRNQMKALEDKNTEYLHRNMELEEEIRKSSTWKNQLEVHRKQVTELQLKLNEETKRGDRLEYEGKRLQDKLSALTLEKERLLNERDKLREVNEELELKLAHAKGSTSASQLNNSSGSIPSPTEVLQIIPPNVKEKIIRLEHENKRLRENQYASSKLEELQLTIDSLRDREQELCSENRSVIVMAPVTLPTPPPVRKFHAEVSKSLTRLIDDSSSTNLKRSQTAAVIYDYNRCLDLGYSLPKNIGRRFSKPSTDSGCHSPCDVSKSGYGTSGVSSPSEEQLYETVSNRSWYRGVSSVDIRSIDTDEDDYSLLVKPLLPGVPKIAKSESVSSEEMDRSMSIIEVSSTPKDEIARNLNPLPHSSSFSTSPNVARIDLSKIRSLPNLKLPLPPKQKRLPSYMKLDELSFIDDLENPNPIEVVVITNEIHRDFSDDSFFDPTALNDVFDSPYEYSGGLELKPITEVNHYEEIPKLELLPLNSSPNKSRVSLSHDFESPNKSKASSSRDLDDYDASDNIRLVHSEYDETSIYSSLPSRPQTGLGRKKHRGKKKMKRALSATANFLFSICGP